MENSLRTKSASGFVVLLVLITGCVPNRRFQASTQPALPIPEPQGLPVAVIEFDGMGELWDRCDLSSNSGKPCQLRDALAFIRRERVEAQLENADAVVVTYVHGWHHNAEKADEDFQAFSRILAGLKKKSNDAFTFCQAFAPEKRSSGCPPRKTRYIGAYVAWRGEVIRTFLKYATAFDREKGGQRTALVSMSEVLVRLRNSAKQVKADDPDAPTQSARFLLFGHSYGGMIVERTMAQMLTASLLPEHVTDAQTCEKGGTGQRPFADLVFLINPAADSIQTEQLVDLMKRSKVKVCGLEGVKNLDPPLIVAIHSRTDFWTGNGFALGHTLESVDKAFRSKSVCDFCDAGVGVSPKQSFLYHNTAEFALYFHNYCYVDGGPTGDWVCDKVTKDVANARKAHVPVDALLAFPPPVKSLPYDSPIANLYKRYDPPWDSTDVHHKPWNNTPYWIFTVPDRIVHQHSGFWNPEFVSLVSSIVQATTPENGTAIQLNTVDVAGNAVTTHP